MLKTKTPSLKYTCFENSGISISVSLVRRHAENLSDIDYVSGVYATIRAERRGLVVGLLGMYTRDTNELNKNLFKMFRDIYRIPSPAYAVPDFGDVSDLCDTITSDIIHMAKII